MLDGIERVIIIIMADRTKMPIEDVRYIGGIWSAYLNYEAIA